MDCSPCPGCTWPVDAWHALIPREVPLINSIALYFVNAFRCSSTALADLKPSFVAISARVGGAPVVKIAFFISSRICCCRTVSFVSAFDGFVREMFIFKTSWFYEQIRLLRCCI